MRRRMIALGLMLVLLLGVMPAGAMAAEGSGGLGQDQWGSILPEAEEAVYAPVRYSAGPTSFDDASPRALAEGEVLRIGVDVSSHQGYIDWEAVAESGVEFAIIRAAWRGYGMDAENGEGTCHRDGWFAYNVRQAQANGIRVGAYIFSQATTVAEAEEEADYIIDYIEDEDLTMDLPLVIDFEYAPEYGRLEAANLSRQAATDVCNAFCDRVEQAGYQGMTYANRYFLESKLYADQLDRVWLANYAVATGYKGAYEYWQFSSRGVIPGIEGGVDLDFWFEPGGVLEVKMPFTDVHAGDWFYSDVKWAYRNKIVNGVTGTTFAPDQTASRAEIITMLYRMAGEPYVSGSSGFTDVSTKDYYFDAVRWAKQKGITNGVSATRFGPNELMPRQQLITMLYRMAGQPASSQSLKKFSDSAQVADYARSAMAWAVEQGLIEGYEDNTLRPEQNITRAEVCKLLRSYSEL